MSHHSDVFFFLVFLTLFSFSIFSAIHSDTMCIWSGFTFRSIYNIFQVASVLLVKTKMSALCSLCEAFVEKAVATPPSPARRAIFCHRQLTITRANCRGFLFELSNIQQIAGRWEYMKKIPQSLCTFPSPFLIGVPG